MRVECPACKQAIPADSINVAKDVAMCPACNEAFALSELVAEGHETDVELTEPPGGTWFRTEANGWELGGTTRHPIAFFLVPFMCVWSGFSLGGIHGSQIVQSKFNLVMSLFGLPFVAGTLLFGSIMLMTIVSKVTIRVEDGEGVIFHRRRSFRMEPAIKVGRRRSRRGDRDKFPEPGRLRKDAGSGRQDEVDVRLDAEQDRRCFFLQVLRRMLRGSTR